MNQTNKWKADFLVYDVFDSAGGLLMVAYALMIESYPFLILNGIWAIVLVRDVWAFRKKQERDSYSTQEKTII